jgi:hypothetical protein
VKINLVLPPWRFIFPELAKICGAALTSLGHEVTYATSPIADALNIAFAAHARDISTFLPYREHTVIYNWEPVVPGSAVESAEYASLLSSGPVWDYSRANISALRAYGIADADWVPLGYIKEGYADLGPKPGEQDIDVFFYGQIKPRRRRVLQRIRELGLNLVYPNSGLHYEDSQRNDLIRRSKVVLNMHGVVPGRFEIARVGLLLANRKAVVSEISDTTDVEPDLRDAVVHGDIDALPELCRQLVNDAARRATVEQRGFELFSKRDERAYLQSALERLTVRRPVERIRPVPANPTEMTVGARDCWSLEALNVDRTDTTYPDSVLNMFQSLSLPCCLPTARYGEVRLVPGRFDRITAGLRASDIANLAPFIRNALLLLRDGGTLNMTLFFDASPTAAQGDLQGFDIGVLQALCAEGALDCHFEIRDTQFSPNLKNPNLTEILRALNFDLYAASRMPGLVEKISLELVKRQQEIFIG